jgi:prepilin-type N-terminal cleavage/methylation domain-containing protein
MQKYRNVKSTNRGFTLVELSIVLVIIGLIVGGVLTGQALIQAAKVRAQLTQIEQLDTAMNAFRAKFDCLPGDCQPNSGVLNAAGDGDGLIDYGAWSAALESALAWSQMAEQSMVTGSYTPAGTFTTEQIGAAKLGGFIMIGSDATTNYYALTNYTGSPVTLNTVPIISADAARTIDAKRDDGRPNTGTTTAVTAGTDPFTAVVFSAATGAANCSAVAGVYQLSSATAVCTLRIRSSG